MKNLIYSLPLLCILGCSDSSEKGKWSETDIDKCVSQMKSVTSNNLTESNLKIYLDMAKPVFTQK